MTLNEIQKILNGHKNREERLMQRDWEIARWQIMHIVAPYSKSKMLRASDIASFYWEKKQNKIPNREDAIDILQKWERWDEKHKNG